LAAGGFGHEESIRRKLALFARKVKRKGFSNAEWGMWNAGGTVIFFRCFFFFPAFASPDAKSLQIQSVHSPP